MVRTTDTSRLFYRAHRAACRLLTSQILISLCTTQNRAMSTRVGPGPWGVLYDTGRGQHEGRVSETCGVY